MERIGGVNCWSESLERIKGADEQLNGADEQLDEAT